MSRQSQKVSNQRLDVSLYYSSNTTKSHVLESVAFNGESCL
jgi:hypothetical protein